MGGNGALLGWGVIGGVQLGWGLLDGVSQWGGQQWDTNRVGVLMEGGATGEGPSGVIGWGLIGGGATGGGLMG